MNATDNFFQNKFTFNFFQGINHFFFCLFSFICYFIAVFLGNVIYYDLSYNCSDDITNEVLRKENENTKKSIVYTAANLGLDLFLIFINILSILILKIIKICQDAKPCSCICFKRRFRNQNNYAQNKYNYSEKYGNYPAREVVVDNKPPVIDEKYNKPQADNIPAQNPVADLGVPPNVFPPPNSDAKL